MSRGPSIFNRLSVAAGLAFLYAPMVLLVAYSFNASRLVTVWGGFSLRWYATLFRDEALMRALWVTIRLGVVSATLATLLGTLAAVAMARGRRSPARTLFFGMVYAPLVMPEVITGLSLLLLFVAVGLARGFWTVTLAHATFTLCYVAVLVRARLASTDPALEEAAQDLGCPPWRSFMVVTLPMIAPAIGAGWMLAFILSLDDLVVASFTAGPGATTLPMRIYSQVRLGVSPEINAACTLLIGAAALAVAVQQRLGARSRKEVHLDQGAVDVDAVARSPA
jgi:putrescine transport system permease protein